MKRRMLVLLLAGIWLISCACLAETSDAECFSYDGSIDWNSTEAQVLDYLGDEAVYQEDSDVVAGYTISLAMLDNGTFLGYPCRRICMFFWEHQLSEIYAYYLETDGVDLQQLMDALKDQYGAGTIQGDHTYSLADLIGDTHTYCKWEIGKDTEIELSQPSQLGMWEEPQMESSYEFIVAMENTPLVEELNRIIAG